jgi:glycosyltransferase involved in cell wall biosynthesis
MRLLVINQYYPPDVASTGRYMAEICTNLVQRGFCVHVVTGQPSYTSSSPNAPSFEVMDGVYVHRVSLANARGRERMRVRLEGYLRFLLGAWRRAQALINSEHFDCVLTFHNPPFVGLIGAYLASRYGLRFVFAWYDIYPDALIVAGWRLPRPLIWAWERVNRWILAKADKVIVLGEGVKHTLVERKRVPSEKVKVIPIWGIPEFTPKPQTQYVRQELGISDKELLLLYSGNMGIMHPLDPILDAAALLQGSPVHFLFVGDGVQRKHLTSRVEKENLKNVLFLPFQPEDRFIQLVAASDACFVSFQPGMERVTVPSRAFTFLSAGRPLITIMAPEADVARLVTERECGWNITTGQELAELVLQLLNNPLELRRRGQRGREVYEECFRREIVIKEYIKVLEGKA